MQPLKKLPFRLIAATAVAFMPILGILIQPGFSNQPQKVSSIGNYLHLISLRANEITVGTRNTQYSFSINVPKTSKPIKKVSVSQRGGAEKINFNQSAVRVVGSSERQKPLKVSQVEIDSKTRGITATFDPPIKPGQVLTLTVGVDENPLSEGTYLFNVAVYTGKEPNPISLGVGRLRITSIQ